MHRCLACDNEGNALGSSEAVYSSVYRVQAPAPHAQGPLTATMAHPCVVIPKVMALTTLADVRDLLEQRSRMAFGARQQRFIVFQSEHFCSEIVAPVVQFEHA